MTKEEMLRFIPPSAELLGREIVEIDEENGAVVLRYTAQPSFLNRHGTVQGGLLAAMLDSATALALYAVLPADLTGVTTSLNTSFLRPAKPGAFTARAQLLSRDERSAETRGELTDSEGQLVARATASLRIVRRTGK